jgi:hypothetical protein
VTHLRWVHSCISRDVLPTKANRALVSDASNMDHYPLLTHLDPLPCFFVQHLLIFCIAEKAIPTRYTCRCVVPHESGVIASHTVDNMHRMTRQFPPSARRTRQDTTADTDRSRDQGYWVLFRTPMYQRSYRSAGGRIWQLAMTLQTPPKTTWHQRILVSASIGRRLRAKGTGHSVSRQEPGYHVFGERYKVNLSC